MVKKLALTCAAVGLAVGGVGGYLAAGDNPSASEHPEHTLSMPDSKHFSSVLRVMSNEHYVCVMGRARSGGYALELGNHRTGEVTRIFGDDFIVLMNEHCYPKVREGWDPELVNSVLIPSGQ